MLVEGQLYHIYNQGNDHVPFFKDRDNYLYFLTKARKLIYPHCTILAYCLMPNHFHFMVEATSTSIEEIPIGDIMVSRLSNGYRSVLSGYAKGFNVQNKRSGSLFRQKTKYKPLENSDSDYPLICFNYIHQNPLKASLVKRLEDWEFSSFRDYLGERNGTLCNRHRAAELLGLDTNYFKEQAYREIPKNKLGGIL